MLLPVCCDAFLEALRRGIVGVDPRLEGDHDKDADVMPKPPQSGMAFTVVLLFIAWGLAARLVRVAPAVDSRGHSGNRVSLLVDLDLTELRPIAPDAQVDALFAGIIAESAADGAIQTNLCRLKVQIVDIVWC